MLKHHYQFKICSNEMSRVEGPAQVHVTATLPKSQEWKPPAPTIGRDKENMIHTHTLHSILKKNEYSHMVSWAQRVKCCIISFICGI